MLIVLCLHLTMRAWRTVHTDTIGLLLYKNYWSVQQPVAMGGGGRRLCRFFVSAVGGGGVVVVAVVSGAGFLWWRHTDAARAGAVVGPVALDGLADAGASGGCGEGGGDDGGGGIAAEPEPVDICIGSASFVRHTI
jgi:hypothetical protein